MDVALCDGLMTMDVMLCTASIFNLCAISVDRFEFHIILTMIYCIALLFQRKKREVALGALRHFCKKECKLHNQFLAYYFDLIRVAERGHAGFELYSYSAQDHVPANQWQTQSVL